MTTLNNLSTDLTFVSSDGANISEVNTKLTGMMANDYGVGYSESFNVPLENEIKTSVIKIRPAASGIFSK